MRILLMIGNANVAIRELYTQVLRERFPGWGISQMSGLPSNPFAIVTAFDVLVYELGPPDDPRRYQAILSLQDDIQDAPRPRVITHIEGPYREGIVAEVQARGVICVGTPFSFDTIAAAIEQAAPERRAQASARPSAASARRGGFLRGLFRRG